MLGGMLSYSLDWDRSGVQFSEGGDSWSATNNLGIEFQIDRGFVVSNRMELLPCLWPPPEGDAGVGDLALRALSWITGARAHAGHSGDPPNSTRTRNWAEPIHKSLTVGHSAHETSAEAYCQFSYAIARADIATIDRPDEPSLVGSSLTLSGRWRAAPDQPWLAFDWETAMPWGVLWDFVWLESAQNQNDALVAVTVTRPLLGILTDLNPATQSVEVLGNKAVQNMVEGMRVTLEHRGELWVAQAH
jgi:hypothetical protein